MQFSIVVDNRELPRTWIASSRERTAEFAWEVAGYPKT